MTGIDQKNQNRETARIVGAPFITATVASVVGYQLVLGPILVALIAKGFDERQIDPSE